MMGRSRRRRSRSATPQPAQQPAKQPFPTCCADRRVDGTLLRQWQAWVDSGCPGIDSPECGDELSRTAARAARWAATAATEGELCDMARSEWVWVRMAVAGNPHTPITAYWGDGVVWYGLAGDPDPWVRAAAVMASPEPPDTVVDAVMQAAGR